MLLMFVLELIMDSNWSQKVCQFNTLPSFFLYKFFLIYTESAKLRAKRALVAYVPSCPMCFEPCVLSCLMCFVSYVSSCLTCLVPYAPCTLSALVSQVLRTLRSFVSNMSYVLLYLTCLVHCVFSCCLCLVPCVLFCSSSLTYFRWFKANILICISCLVAFMSCGSCPFGAWVIRAFYSLG